MAIVVEDRHGRQTKKRKAEGPPLDRRTARYYSVVGNVWSRGYPTRKEAERDEADRKRDREDGTSVTLSKTTLADFIADEWLPLQERKHKHKDSRTRLRASTLAHYRLHVEQYIIPAIGSKRLRDLRPQHLRKLYGDLADRGGRYGKGLAPATVRHTHTILSDVLELAVSDGFAARNVAKARDVAPEARSPEMKTWTPDELRAFLDEADDDRLAAAWRLAATTGMRRGEVLGLRWSDVDLDDQTVSVERALVLVDNEPRYEPPKTERGERVVSIDPTTAAALRAHRKRQKEEQVAAFGAWPGGDDEHAGLVFTREDGQPLNPNTFSRTFARLAKRAGLPPIRLHDLRHTAVTILLAAGEQVDVVSRRVGHASTSITWDTYGHAQDGQDRKAADRLAEVLDG